MIKMHKQVIVCWVVSRFLTGQSKSWERGTFAFRIERLGTLALAAYRKTLDDNMLLSHFLSRPIFNFDSVLHSDSPTLSIDAVANLASPWSIAHSSGIGCLHLPPSSTHPLPAAFLLALVNSSCGSSHLHASSVACTIVHPPLILC